jgi:hypothetical protein
MTDGEKAQLASQGTAIFASLDKSTHGRHSAMKALFEHMDCTAEAFAKKSLPTMIHLFVHQHAETTHPCPTSSPSRTF